MDITPKMERSIIGFFDAFGKLSPDEKLYFLAEIDKALSKKDEKEKKLYLALMKAAREKKTCAETISAMRKA